MRCSLNQLILLPIIIPFLTGIICVLAFKQQRVQQVVSMVGAVGLFTAVILLFRHVYLNVLWQIARET